MGVPVVTLSIDAMGGDQAPDIVLDALLIAHQRFPEVRFKLFGDEALLAPRVFLFPEALKNLIEVIHTSQIVGPDVKPSMAVRSYKDSSMYRAVKAVADGEAQGVISAGNTGAYMAISLLVLRPVPGISRPAIATLLPNLKGASVVLDLGANVVCDVDNLVQFALMGSAFASIALGKESPSVGLLNIGSEELKGGDVIRDASAILRNTAVVNFQGFVEGDDISKGTVDVVVTDGFTGNVALKTVEGVAKMMVSFARDAFMSSWLSKLGFLLVRAPMQRLRKHLDPRLHNGAIFIGLNRVAIKSHGGTDAVGFANALGVALKTIENRLNEKIIAKLAECQEAVAQSQVDASSHE